MKFDQAIPPSKLPTSFMNGPSIYPLFREIHKCIFFSYRDKRDIDCDIRENIINYEDEGGGEGDQTGYDLSVLRMMSDGTPALHAGQPNKMMKFSPHDAPDIQTFLQTNKVRNIF